MRVSPCGWLPTQKEVVAQARRSAECTHNHPEGIKGAECVARCIETARWAVEHQEDGQRLVAKVAESYGYRLDQTCDEIRRTNYFDETCQVTVPQAIICFLESTDFESAIRLAVSIGGDSDTIAAIAGSIAEAYHGIPTALVDKAWGYLPQEMQEVVVLFKQKYG